MEAAPSSVRQSRRLPRPAAAPAEEAAASWRAGRRSLRLVGAMVERQLELGDRSHLVGRQVHALVGRVDPVLHPPTAGVRVVAAGSTGVVTGGAAASSMRRLQHELADLGHGDDHEGGADADQPVLELELGRAEQPLERAEASSPGRSTPSAAPADTSSGLSDERVEVEDRAAARPSWRRRRRRGVSAKAVKPIVRASATPCGSVAHSMTASVSTPMTSPTMASQTSSGRGSTCLVGRSRLAVHEAGGGGAVAEPDGEEQVGR